MQLLSSSIDLPRLVALLASVVTLWLLAGGAGSATSGGGQQEEESAGSKTGSFVGDILDADAFVDVAAQQP